MKKLIACLLLIGMFVSGCTSKNDSTTVHETIAGVAKEAAIEKTTEDSANAIEETTEDTENTTNAIEGTSETTEEITDDNSESGSIRKTVYICDVVSVDSEYVVLSYGNMSYKISALDCDWVNEKDMVTLTFSSDKLKKISDNSYLVTDGFVSPFIEYVEK